MLTALVLSSCNPVYETRYSYDKTLADMDCATVCYSQKVQCEAQLKQLEIQCESIASAEYQACMADKQCEWVLETYYCTPKVCPRRSCAQDYDNCVILFNSCFEGCGGKVTSYQECVKYCDQE